MLIYNGQGSEVYLYNEIFNFQVFIIPPYSKPISKYKKNLLPLEDGGGLLRNGQQ